MVGPRSDPSSKTKSTSLVFRVVLVARVIHVLDRENGNFEHLPSGVQPKADRFGQSGSELSGFALCGILQPN